MSRAENGVGQIRVHPSGEWFNILRPTVEMVSVEDIARSLSMLCRFNGHLPSFYSVAEHSVRVADYLNLTMRVPELALAGLLHDAAEAYIGDMVYPLKSVPNVGDPFKAVERELEVVIGEKFGVELWPMDPRVKEADQAVYDWENQHIRTGEAVGWTQEAAEAIFLFSARNEGILK